MTKESIDFARSHLHDDTARLLLSAARYPGIDMPDAVQQIEGLRTAEVKWPSLFKRDGLIYPPRLNREQASSEATALYKASLNPLCARIADLTGGMGIDTLAFAAVAEHVDYVERDPALCSMMEHNLHTLGITNVSIHCDDSLAWLESQERFDMLYIDPSRRSVAGRRVAAFEDCTPNLLASLPLLRSRCRHLLVKASPMIDIRRATEQLGAASEVHIVAVHGECKEVLFLCGEEQSEPQINCVELANGYSQAGAGRIISTILLSFAPQEEASAEPQYSDCVERYLYDPHSALRKAGCYRLLGQRCGLPKLGPNTHLYTSPTLLPGFPGRVFEVLQEVGIDRKAVKSVLPDSKAHVVVRNFPAEASDLQRQLGLREGGDLFLIATTLGSRHLALLCRCT